MGYCCEALGQFRQERLEQVHVTFTFGTSHSFTSEKTLSECTIGKPVGFSSITSITFRVLIGYKVSDFKLLLSHLSWQLYICT